MNTKVNNATDNVTLNSNQLAGMIDAEFEASFEELFEASAKKIRGPLVILAELNRVFGDKLVYFPVPDSPHDPKSNVLTDKYETKVKTDDGYKTLKGSWYKDFYMGTHRGARMGKEIEAIGLAISKPTDVPAEYRDLNKLTKNELESRRKALRQNTTYAVNLIKRAMKVYQQMALINEKLPKIGVEFLTGEDGNVSMSPVPIVVFNKDKMIESKVISVGTLISYDVDKALRDGGSVQDLWATAGSGEGDSGGANDSEPETSFDITVAKFDDLVAELQNFLEGNGGINMAHLSNAIKKWDDSSILSLGDLCSEFQTIYNMIQPRYEKLATAKAA
jgi:hypothetical protein